MTCRRILGRGVRFTRAGGDGARAGCGRGCSSLSRRKRRGELRHLDSSHIKLHQHGANRRGGQAGEAIGRTKGGLNSKLAALVDGCGRAVALHLTAGPRHDLNAIEPLLPALRGKRAVGDKGFDADTFRVTLHRHGARICISPRRRRRFRFHRGYYRHRAETVSAASSASAASPPRYDKLSLCFLSLVLLAAILDCSVHRFENTP